MHSNTQYVKTETGRETNRETDRDRQRQTETDRENKANTENERGGVHGGRGWGHSFWLSEL